MVDIVGTDIRDQGRSCEEHIICGHVLCPDVIVQFRKEEIMVEGRIEMAICMYWVMDSVECCPVGFLPCYMVPHANSINGLLTQVSQVFDSTANNLLLGRRCARTIDSFKQQFSICRILFKMALTGLRITQS